MKQDFHRRRNASLCNFAFAILAMMITTVPAMAGTGVHVSRVKIVYPLSNGAFVLVFVVDPPTCASASTPKCVYVTPGSNGVNMDGAKNMLATALTAFAMDKNLGVAFDDASTQCFINRLWVE